MTNLEAITAAIGIPGFSDLAVQKALLDAGLDPAGTYIANDVSVTKAALVVLKGMLGLQQIQEGDYSITYAIKERIAAIEDELGIGNDRVQNASFFW